MRTCAGPEQFHQWARYKPLLSYLKANGIDYPSLPQAPLESLKETDVSSSTEEYVQRVLKNIAALADLVDKQISSMSAAQVCVITNALHVHESFLMGTLLAMGECSPHEYADTVLAANGISSKEFSDVSSKEYRRSFERMAQDAALMIQYIRLSHGGQVTVLDIIKSGENQKVEFKSSLRWNYKANQTDRDIEHSSLKTIAGFLNTKGGVLLVGVDDQGKVLGLEKDGFSNRDKYGLHFYNLVKSSMGEDIATLIDAEFHNVNGKDVFCVNCSASSRPVYLKFKGEEEEFYVRTGPGSTKLSMSKATEYIKTRFEN